MRRDNTKKTIYPPPRYSLASNREINYFARKWRWKFFDRYPDLDCFEFADSCWELGFKMDSGESFIRAFPKQEVKKPQTLRKIIKFIDDVELLGTAIFSYWRYQTHWADSFCMSIFSNDTRNWFLIALDRLIELTTDYKIILSNNDGSGNCVISASDNRIIICREGEPCYGPIAAEYFYNAKAEFNCQNYAPHSPTRQDDDIIKKALSAGMRSAPLTQTLPTEAEFWGQCNRNRESYTYVELEDNSVVEAKSLTNQISVAGVFAIPDRTNVLSKIAPGSQVLLVRESDNKHDENAIRVETSRTHRKLGYIPRKLAAKLNIELARGFRHYGVITECNAATQKIIINIKRGNRRR